MDVRVKNLIIKFHRVYRIVVVVVVVFFFFFILFQVFVTFIFRIIHKSHLYFHTDIQYWQRISH